MTLKRFLGRIQNNSPDLISHRALCYNESGGPMKHSHTDSTADPGYKRRDKRAKFYKLDYLYRWKALLNAPVERNDEDVFRDVEKLLYKSGLHSKLAVEHNKYVLYVRESEFDYAKDLADGTVSAVYGKTIQEYILFKDDYEYKNEKFYMDQSNCRKMRINARMSMFIIAIVIIISMFILYYTTK